VADCAAIWAAIAIVTFIDGGGDAGFRAFAVGLAGTVDIFLATRYYQRGSQR
jgi:hypothetical protein